MQARTTMRSSAKQPPTRCCSWLLLVTVRDSSSPDQAALQPVSSTVQRPRRSHAVQQAVGRPHAAPFALVQAPQRHRVTKQRFGSRTAARIASATTDWRDAAADSKGRLSMPTLLGILTPRVVWSHAAKLHSRQQRAHAGAAPSRRDSNMEQRPLSAPAVSDTLGRVPHKYASQTSAVHTPAGTAVSRPIQAQHCCGGQFDGIDAAGHLAHGVYEGSYWQLLADADELHDTLAKLAAPPPLTEVRRRRSAQAQTLCAPYVLSLSQQGDADTRGGVWVLNKFESLQHIHHCCADGPSQSTQGVHLDAMLHLRCAAQSAPHGHCLAAMLGRCCRRRHWICRRALRTSLGRTMSQSYSLCQRGQTYQSLCCQSTRSPSCWCACLNRIMSSLC